MTILYNETTPEFDPDPALDADDRAQPLTVEPYDAFIVLTQWDCGGEVKHCILIEHRDVQALIEALQRTPTSMRKVGTSSAGSPIGLNTSNKIA